MPITPPPPAPNRSQPATFSDRSDAFLGWLVGFVPELNGALSVLGANGYAAISGSANAIVLTAGYPALVTGMLVRFRPTVANTAGVTINLDGFGARQCRTVIGSVLPPGYLRAGVFTEAYFNGTHWIVDREIEQGSNGNGRFIKYADGRMDVTHAMNVADVTTNLATGPFYRSDVLTWNYPHAFNLSTGVHPVPSIGCASTQRWITLGPTLTEALATYVVFGAFNNTGTITVRASALGRWY